MSEVRQQQVATADVLKAISRSAFDLQVVLDTLTQSAAGLCDADHAWLYRQDGDIYRYAASYGHSKEAHERIKQHLAALRFSAGRGSAVARALLEGRTVQIDDVLRVLGLYQLFGPIKRLVPGTQGLRDVVLLGEGRRIEAKRLKNLQVDILLSIPISTANVMSADCRPPRIAPTISGASKVIRRTRPT